MLSLPDKTMEMMMSLSNKEIKILIRAVKDYLNKNKIAKERNK